MKRQILTIVKGDTTLKALEIYNHQPDGLYRYIPKTNDEIKLIMFKDGEEVTSVDATKDDPENIYFDIDTSSMDPGIYTYDVTIKTGNRLHHIVKEQEINII